MKTALLLLLLQLAGSVHPLSTAPSPSSLSIGERIQRSQTAPELLEIAADLWLPTDENLPSHLRTQRVHHEKRQRWSAHLLGKLGSALGEDGQALAWEDDGFTRAVLASAIPFGDDRPDKEGRCIREALIGLHNVFGYAVDPSSLGKPNLPVALREGLLQLVERADNMAPLLPLCEVAEIRWACLSILWRSNILDAEVESHQLIPQLCARVANLPFDIVTKVVDWDELLPATEIVPFLQDEIPFNFDTIVTRTGAKVVERRGTAWIAEEGVGSLAYSGKLMPPQSLPESVRSIMRAVESRVVDSMDPQPFFDCALCNHYPDGESACKFHTDPEHGSHWERLTCVIAAGSSRRFAFRPIPGQSEWNLWESSQEPDSPLRTLSSEPHAPAAITLFPGDVVKMWGSCNDDFHHAVYSGQARTSGQNEGRISLVLKRAIARGGGIRGHGLSGQGRRSRRQATLLNTPTQK